ncbi:MAG: hypothetical protein AAFY73_10180 [Pseudomonadota bacterium]
MTETKPWYASKTVWASLVAVLGGILSFFGLPLPAGTEAILAERFAELATVVAGLFALYGRLTAHKRIKVLPQQPPFADFLPGD